VLGEVDVYVHGQRGGDSHHAPHLGASTMLLATPFGGFDAAGVAGMLYDSTFQCQIVLLFFFSSDFGRFFFSHFKIVWGKFFGFFPPKHHPLPSLFSSLAGHIP
jgi:hypothetical protein